MSHVARGRHKGGNDSANVRNFRNVASRLCNRSSNASDTLLSLQGGAGGPKPAFDRFALTLSGLGTSRATSIA